MASAHTNDGRDLLRDCELTPWQTIELRSRNPDELRLGDECVEEDALWDLEICLEKKLYLHMVKKEKENLGSV